MVVKAVFGSEEGEEAAAIDEDALHLPRRWAAAASPTWRYLLLETSRKVVWTVPASARELMYGPPAALLLGPAGSCESERSRRVTSRRRSRGESRRACSRVVTVVAIRDHALPPLPSRHIRSAAARRIAASISPISS